jgi:arginyl-tRNA synthetase
MTSLSQKLSDIVGGAFEALGLPRELGVVRVSDRPDLAQFQCNGAMAAAKVLGKNPREVAQGVVDTLSKHAEFTKLEIAGPGFININVTDEFITAHLAETARSETLGVPNIGGGAEVILDYGGPNIAKAMHVGHLRSSIIGDALRRIYLFAGYKAIGDVHMGDWGTPMGMILSELELMNFSGEITMDFLAEIYPKAAQACKEDAARMELARAATKKLQDGDVASTKRWREFIDVSIAGMKENFDALGVQFDEWKGEADAHPYIAGMVADFKAKGFAVESEGALIVPVAREDDKKEIPPLILLKSDGAVLYGTTDLATIIDRLKTHKPAKIIYCVDQRQSLHFEQVFRAAKIGGIISGNTPELVFAGFGTMNGTDGKPFKTRAGGVMKLEDLIAMGLEKATSRLKEADIAADLSEAEKANIAHKVALAAIKFADLQNARQSDYVFDLDRMTSFEGKTGPYLLYQAVRIKSLLRKAEEQRNGGMEKQKIDPFLYSSINLCIQEADRPLALLLTEFPDHFALALANNTPHVLCDYVYKLAQAFSSFYGNCHILSEPDETVRASRLALCARTYAQIEIVLALLGIEIPERM